MTMETAKRNRLLLWIAVILLTANLAFIGWHFFGRSRFQSGPRRGPELLFKRMGFDEQQRAEAATLADRHFAAIGPLRDSLRQAKLELFTSAGRQVTDSLFSARLKKVSWISVKVDSTMILHLRELRSLCREDQLEKFDRFTERMAAGFSNGGPPMGRKHGRPGQ